MCTGRIDLAFVLRAFAKRADGVLIAGCHLNECNYITHGNYYALAMTHLCKRMLEHVGINPERLRMELISGGEGSRFAEMMNDFSRDIKSLGPIGVGEGIAKVDLDAKLEELTSLVPYIKLVKKEKLRLRLDGREEYDDLFTRDEIDQLLNEVVSYYIDPEKCQACMICAKRCPVDAIEGGKNRIHVIDQDACIKCGSCFEACPPRFGAVGRIAGDPAPPPIPEEERAIARGSRA